MAANVGALDPSEELVTQFCAVTGADRSVGRQLLEICNGNLEMAIGMHMDEEEGVGADRALASGSGSQSRLGPVEGLEPGAAATAAEEGEDLNGIRAPIPQRHEVLVEEAPKYPGFRGTRRLRRSVFDGFRDFQAEARQQENLMAAGHSFSKERTLEDLFRPPIDMTYKGMFETAREAGTSQNKWLMVNIQNVQEFKCQVLNRDIWSNATVKALVKKHFIFWQVYHDSMAGQKYMQYYKVEGWPYVAFIDPVTGENQLTLNKVELPSFTDLIREFVSEHPNPENPGAPPAKRQKRVSSIVDASEEAQMEAAIKASLSSHCQQPAVPSSSSTTSMPSASAIADCNDSDSDQSEEESDELETFTGSEDEGREATSRSAYPPGSQERASSSQRRNFSAVSGRTVSSHPGSSGSGIRSSGGASSSGAAAASAGVSSPHHALSATPEDTSVPSTSSSRDVVRLAEDSENESSQGFRESYANTPNSVDILSSRSSEFHMLDSSSNSSSLVSGGLAVVDHDEDTVECDRLSGGQGGSRGDDVVAAGSPAWHKHFGEASDPATNLVIRFPDGKKEQLSLPCSSKLEALFVFCSSKGFSQESYELVVNFPRRTLTSLDPGSTIKEARLHPQETVFVQAR